MFVVLQLENYKKAPQDNGFMLMEMRSGCFDGQGFVTPRSVQLT